MYLKKIRLENYRNIAIAEIILDRHISVFYGSNGQGKTNLLESVYLLGNGKPFRPARVSELVCHEKSYATVIGRMSSGDVDKELNLYLSGSERRFLIDSKPVYRSSELHGILPTVIFTPDDTSMIKLGPENRRKTLDRMLYGCDRKFLHCYHTYYRILKQRNTLLRTGNRSGLDEWTDQLIDAGNQLMQQRHAFLVLINSLFQEAYRRISGNRETVSLSYKPDARMELYSDLLHNGVDMDMKNGTTMRGPHRDDLQFLINGRALKIFGSQGQQRSFVLALKMAELENLQSMFNEPPILLLDDMASELDQHRIANLMSFLKDKKIQTLVTTTALETLPEVFFESASRFRVENGTLTYEETKRR